VLGHRVGWTTIADQDRCLDRCHAAFLQAIERIGYRLPDFSSMKTQTLIQYSMDVPRVSERQAIFNHMDVVRRV
jgi:hypothetical protein